MKKFKFKLDGLLKVREFKEKKLKAELGEILKDIAKEEDNIRKLKSDIDDSYKAQEEFLAEPAAGQMIQFFPQFIEAKNQDIKVRENLLYSLGKKYDLKLHEMAIAKGEVKVIEKLKEKKKAEHTKEKDKKLMQETEEFIAQKRHRELEETI